MGGGSRGSYKEWLLMCNMRMPTVPTATKVHESFHLKCIYCLLGLFDYLKVHILSTDSLWSAGSHQNAVWERHVMCEFPALQMNKLPLRSTWGCQCIDNGTQKADRKHSAPASNKTHGTTVPCGLLQCILKK